jgi:hypothetical protein
MSEGKDISFKVPWGDSEILRFVLPTFGIRSRDFAIHQIRTLESVISYSLSYGLGRSGTPFKIPGASAHIAVAQEHHPKRWVDCRNSESLRPYLKGIPVDEIRRKEVKRGRRDLTELQD